MFKSLLFKGKSICIMLLCILSSMAATAQTRITGKVIGSDDKQPVIGATVKIKGTNAGVVTDVNGTFALNAKVGDVLVISYVGYQPKSVEVTGPALGAIVLDITSSSLNEVVVTGYQTQLKKDISGSVATVDIGAAKELNVVSAENLLQGQAAGVTVLTQGAPGSGGQVLIRGIGNLGDASPLIVIDGAQQGGGLPSSMGPMTSSTSGGMSNLNPNDIESITVLKDAGATAIYGVRGGNGVIVITTKKGKAGKSQFSYDGFYGSTSPKSGNVWNVLGGADYLKLIQQVDPQNTLVAGGIQDYGFQGPGVKGVGGASDPRAAASNYFLDPNTPSNDYLIQKFNNGAGTDWFHAIFKAAPIQQHSVTASGANGKNNYLFSLAYTDQQGTLIDTYMKRYQARFNTNFSLSDHVRVGESAQVYYVQNPNQFGNNGEGNTISMSYRMEPQIPVYDIKGGYGGTWDGPTQLGNANNPVAGQNSTSLNEGKSWNIEGNAYAEADFLKYFTVRTSIGGTVYNYSYADIANNPYWSGEGHGNVNGFFEGSGFGSQYNWTNTINYKQTFGKHTVTVLGGFEARSNYQRFINAQQTSFFSLDPAFVGINNGSGAILANSGIPVQGQETGLSEFGRIDYNYNSRYYLAATIRRDGSSIFYPGHQYGTFPSVSAAWRISQEDFLKGVSWLNDLKLRGSYGESGFEGNVNSYNAYSGFKADPGNSSYAIGGLISSASSGFYPINYGNTKTTWETDKLLNIGFDAALFNHLDLNVEWYKKTSSHLLFTVPLPATVGSGQPPAVNVGQVSNKGLDVSATYHGAVGQDFKFNIGANITSYKNNIDYLASPIFVNSVRNGNITRDAVGSPIGEFYGYKVIGYFASAADVAASPVQADAAPGRFKYADVNGDGKITDADRVNIGNPNPDFTYGLNLSASYKGFDASVVLYGSYGNKDYNYIKYWTDFYSTLTGNKSKDLLFNSWSPSNLNPKTPKAESVSTFSSDQTINSWYVESGSFLKLRVAQIGYTFSSQQLKATGVSKIHVYIQGNNLFTITKYTGIDPELQATTDNGIGTDQGNYPSNERRVILGVNLTF
ncbi:MAG: SusC/RagA family TonB-linked outer membrane protein [Mucilaginibacter sp.]